LPAYAAPATARLIQAPRESVAMTIMKATAPMTIHATLTSGVFARAAIRAVSGSDMTR